MPNREGIGMGYDTARGLAPAAKAGDSGSIMAFRTVVAP